MTVKEWLNNGRKINDELLQLREERQRAYDLACSCTVGASDEKVQTSPKNTSDGKFAAFADYSALIDKKVFELLTYQCRIRRLINRLDNPTYRTLLAWRYIHCETWEDVAEKMNYSDVWVRTELHSRALAAAEEIFNTSVDEK